MNTDKNKNTFSYTYSASDNEEINKIRSKYIPREPDKLEQLRKLDKSVTRKGTVLSLTVGIISTLVFGTGMCCVLLWADKLFTVGIITGFIGLAGCLTAYPVYSRITETERKKIAPEIIRLSDELLNGRK
ncbi:MAG: hypothetical protein IJ446_04595 [Oscillospiraceae bacterium]|nr:hypothetical protein [Oscillospiraceae bacterium]